MYSGEMKPDVVPRNLRSVMRSSFKLFVAASVAVAALGIGCQSVPDTDAHRAESCRGMSFRASGVARCWITRSSAQVAGAAWTRAIPPPAPPARAVRSPRAAVRLGKQTAPPAAGGFSHPWTAPVDGTAAPAPADGGTTGSGADGSTGPARSMAKALAIGTTTSDIYVPGPAAGISGTVSGTTGGAAAQPRHQHRYRRRSRRRLPASAPAASTTRAPDRPSVRT